MHRRLFLRNVFYGSLLVNLGDISRSSEQKNPDLALVQGGTPDAITRKAIDLLGGMSQFISKDDIVMIKPNMAFDRKPKFAGCTNPDVVGTLVGLCIEAGAKEVRVMDNPVHSARITYVNSGIAGAVEAVGGKLIYPEPERLTSVDVNGEEIKTCSIYKDFIEADKLINVPILKTHSLSRLTMGMKNWLGAVGGNRENLHRNLDRNIVDLAAFFKPTLTVLDAYRIMVKNGPQGGKLSDVAVQKTVVAGRDFVAVDAMGSTICNFKPKQLSFVKEAYKRGLGEMDLEKLHIEMRTR